MSGTTPFDLWLTGWRSAMAVTAAAWRTSETLAASAEVIAQRGGTIGAAVRDPLAADHAELQRMVTEKADAFTQAGLLMWREAAAMQAAWVAAAGQVVALAAAGRPPTPAQATALWSRSADLLGRSARNATTALGPIHRTATANARRLRR